MGRLGKALRVVSRVTLATAIVLVMVPIVISKLTGGTVPRILAPFTGWPSLVVLVGVVVTLEAWEPVWNLVRPVNARRPDDPRNLFNALRQVERYVRQRTEGSMAERVRIQLALDERPEAVMPPAYLVQRVGNDEAGVPLGTGIAEVFHDMQNSMLILGAPGAGKTTLLLDLVAALVASAAESAGKEAEKVVPVLVDLAEWSGAGQPRRSAFNPWTWRRPHDFASWLLASVARRYKIPNAVGRAWLEEGKLALLLDGLDEVQPGSRDRCVHEINMLQEHYPVQQLAVCCREGDYDNLAGPLHMLGAVTIRPLTRSQVIDYFARLGLEGDGGGIAPQDDEVWRLFTSPLMLNVVALAYGSRPVGGLTEGGDVVERRRHLFDAYVVEMLSRRGAPHARYAAEEIVYALKVLATASIRLDIGVAIRRPSPSTWNDWNKALPDRSTWLARARLAPAASLGFLSASLFVIARHFGIVTALVVGTFAVSLYSVMDDNVALPRSHGIHRMRTVPAMAAVFAFSSAVGASTVAAADALITFMTHPPPTLVFLILLTAARSLPVAFGSSRRAATWGGGVVLVLTAVPMWLLGLSPVLRGYSIGLIVTTLAISMVLPFLFKGAVALQPGEAALVRRRRRLNCLSYATTALAAVGAAILVGAPARGPIMGVVAGLVVGLVLGLWVGAAVGAVLRSMLMPLMLLVAGDATPWRRSFWRFAVDRGILTRANIEFRFIHVLVRDHFATCDAEALANSVRRRSAQLLDARPRP